MSLLNGKVQRGTHEMLGLQFGVKDICARCIFQPLGVAEAYTDHSEVVLSNTFKSVRKQMLLLLLLKS